MAPDGRDAWQKVRIMPWTARLVLRRRRAWPFVRYRSHHHGRRGERAPSSGVYFGPYRDHSAHVVPWTYEN
jgi:hypothetical protein